MSYTPPTGQLGSGAPVFRVCCVAFCERAFFSTPYSYAGVRVETSPPCRISVAQGGEEIFRAAMPGEATAIARAALPVADDGWEGPVFLPRRQAAGARRVFFARINCSAR